MKHGISKCLLSIIPLATLFAGTLFTGRMFAQSMVGVWQGTLQAPNRELRIQFRISTTEGDSLRAVMYSIDQPGPPLPVSAVTAQGTAVKMTIPGIGGTYEGKLDSGGSSITGTFTQGPVPRPLNLEHVTDQAAWAIPAPPPPLKPMAPDANPSFEVATIKPSIPNRPGKGFGIQGRRFTTVNTTLSDLITFSYGIHARQLIGAPAWVESDKYDLSAQPDGEGQPSEKQWKAMIQKLLADRFQLAFHRDKKELSVYTVTVGKTGPKLTNSTGDPNGLPALFFPGKLGALNARNANMTDFAGLLQGAVLDRPVLDQTGIKGRYDFNLNWTPDQFQFTGFGGVPPQTEPDANPNPDLYTAIQQQLGLKIESTKASAEVFVIDKVEKPSEN